MNIAVTAPLDRKRWLAALQSGEEALDSLQAQMDFAEQQLLKAADPKAVYRIMNKADIKPRRCFYRETSGGMREGRGDGGYAGNGYRRPDPQSADPATRQWQ